MLCFKSCNFSDGTIIESNRKNRSKTLRSNRIAIVILRYEPTIGLCDHRSYVMIATTDVVLQALAYHDLFEAATLRQGLKNPGFLKPNPAGFIGFCWAFWGFLIFGL